MNIYRRGNLVRIKHQASGDNITFNEDKTKQDCFFQQPSPNRLFVNWPLFNYVETWFSFQCTAAILPHDAMLAQDVRLCVRLYICLSVMLRYWVKML